MLERLRGRQFRWARSASIVLAVAAVLVGARESSGDGDAPGRLVRRVGSCVLVAPADAARAFEALVPRAESVIPEVVQELGVVPRGPFTMVLLPAGTPRDPDFAALNQRAPAWAAGFIDPVARVGAIRLAQAARYPYGTPESVLAHETAHQLLHDARGAEFPQWFEEGVATWVGRTWGVQDHLLLSGRILTSAVPRLAELDSRFRGTEDQVEEAYAASFAFVSWCSRRYGEAAIRNLIREARTGSFDRAWRRATGERLERAEAIWRRDSLFRYRWLPVIMASSTLWLLVLAVAFWVWMRKRERVRALRKAWDEEAEDDSPVAGIEWRLVEEEPPDPESRQEPPVR